MGRWAPDARGRLERAAMELYVERGYDRTTVAEIAERAGVTERTFFRHFADKREVLFQGSELLLQLMVDAVLGAPADTAPLAAVGAGLAAAGAVLGDDPARPRLRQGVVASSPELQEREMVKMAALGAALSGALRERGVPDLAASLAAETGVAVFRVAFERWVTDPAEHAYSHHVREALAELRVITAG